MGTVNEYKFTSRSLQDSEFYLVDNSNKVCGKVCCIITDNLKF